MADFTSWVEQNKALWSRVYDEVIQPSLEKEWNKREETHRHQLKEKEKSHETLLEHLNNEILKSARLSKENSQLKAEVQSKMLDGMKTVSPTVPSEEYRRLAEENEQLKQQLAKHNAEAASLQTENQANKDIDPTTPENEYHDLAQKFSDLSKKYNDATQQVKYLQRKNATVMQKNKDMKDSVRAWQEYADRQSGKQKPKGQARIEEGRLSPSTSRVSPEDQPDIASSPGVLPTLRTSPALTDLGRSSPALMMPLSQAIQGTAHQTTSLDPGSSGRDRSSNATVRRKLRSRTNNLTSSRPHDMSEHSQGVPLGIQRVISDHDNHQQAHPSSSQTTVDEHAEPSARHDETIGIGEDDDMPEFVSERSLKRKRGETSNSRFEIYADRSSDGTPIRPYHVKEEQCSSPPISVYKLLHQETTMDLDDPTLNLLQTPRHNRRRLSIPAAGTEVPRQRRCNSAPLTQDIKIEKGTEQYLAQDDSPGRSAEPRVLPVVESVETRTLSESMEPGQAESTVLKAIDPNIVSSVTEEPPNKRSRQSEARHRRKHGFLLESGEDSPPLDKEPLLPSSARARINERVRSLHGLHTPSKTSPKTPQADSVKVKIEQVPTPPSSSSRTLRTPVAGKNLSKSTSKPRSDPRGHPTPERPIWTMKPPETRSSARKSRPLQSREQGRLREKPITELSIQDFKPNPDYNQGYSYAFSETVRKRGDRMCLPGCTNPQCCGSTFRTFAEAQAPLSASQEEALLEDYLGEAYNTMQLTQMSADERKELVLQARTRKMAKESGKHREAYERRKTPPGFWRVDFPTTQEQQEDRKRAKEQEQAQIRERWIEAQRKGGKWVFRDE
ncbi:uncharacterized protein yc1106_07823 [Curvularia clavata]|uniref:DNA endonuclease activator Ctp1 C-terminal domain-containing protein n=1 Tax=Curvularia clavata TaxID=95742 RepID=A0A9Q8ZDC8_CURCL|nr:uncharacterized protein yc1106_07823 [Curvularia clavata]